MINYRLATKDDIQAISDIHINEFSEYFLTMLGKKLVYKFYESYYENGNILVVAEKNKEVIGFILGTDNSLAREFFFKQNFSKIFWKLVKEFFKGNKILWKGIGRRLFFVKEAIVTKLCEKNSAVSQKVSNSYRLLSIAIKNEERGNNVAYNMEGFFCNQLLESKIKRVGLSVKKDNERAISFYKKCGYDIEKEEEFAIYFIKNI
ncbi:GNAT family N-acetyltransferase [Fusobacterium animalis]|uniref:GNAT family N-acetyltransferase n=1 Tax=Fusobacterium animalis TaxID=76859 RepID=UPI001C6E3F24|nr:GNAT family N-acetyltransferase [Fusobacterium animalis]QYR67290.1 GNAT family N-acetyltransferase [Fusobacterium animalis]